MNQIKLVSWPAVSRRNFLGGSLAVSAGAVGAALLPRVSARASGTLSQGDESILRFLAALEILETDETKALARAKEITEFVLYNPLIETFELEVVKR